jgi:transposase
VPRTALEIHIDFAPGSRFLVDGCQTPCPVHDTVAKRYRHLNFFQHECHLLVRTPRVKLPDGSVRLVSPDWTGRLAGFTLLFEALVLSMCRDMSFSAVARIVGVSPYRVMALCQRYVDLARAQRDDSDVRHVAIDETSSARGQNYVTLAADAERRAVLFVTQGRDSQAIARLAQDLRSHQAEPEQIESVCIDMSAAFIKGVGEHLPSAQITFDKFHVIAHASEALDKTRRAEQKIDPELKGLRWPLLKNHKSLAPDQRKDLDHLLAQITTKRTARAWLYREHLREILNRKQIHVMRRLLLQWTTNVRRSKVEPMKEVADLIRRHLDGIVAWARSRQTNGFLEAINGLFQAAKRRARGYQRLETIRTVIFLLAGKLDFSSINPHLAALPT